MSANPDECLLALCAAVSCRLAAHAASTTGGEAAMARAGQLVVDAALLVAGTCPATMAGIQAKARVAWLLACDGGSEPDSNGLVHTVMIALVRDLI